MPYDTNAMREKLKKSMSGRSSDPNEFRPPKVTGDTVTKYRFFVMPPLTEGDACATGTATRSMDMCYVPFGQHWVNQKPHACPRVASENEIECPMCTKGFALIKEAKARGATKEKTSAIAKQWLPTVANIVNIYFTNSNANPEDLQGKVLYFKLPKACYDLFMECLQREDSGDEESPQAFGAFFDEEAGFLFELVVKCKDGYNNYQSSRFLEKQRPLVAKPDGTPDHQRIQEAMDARHDLWTKGDAADVGAMKKLVSRLWDGDDDSNDDDAGFDKDEVAESRPTPTTSKPSADDDDDRPAPARATTPKTNGKSRVNEEEAPKKPTRRPQLDDEDTPKAPKKQPKVAALEQEAEIVAAPPSKRPSTESMDDMISQLNDD